MKIRKSLVARLSLLLAFMLLLTLLSARLRAQSTGQCPPVNGLPVTLPFTDVQGNPFFCAIAAAYFSGLTFGTTATTYTPSQPVPREQMAAFITRTLDQSLRRGAQRAALGQWWTSRPAAHRRITVGDAPQYLASDGEHVYVSNTLSNNFTIVEASTGRILGTDGNSAMSNLQGILVAAGYVWTLGFFSGPNTYGISQVSLDGGSGGASGIDGINPLGLTCDGANIWTANFGTGPNTGSITRAPIAGFPSGDTTFTAGFNRPFGIVFDGAWLWVTDQGDHALKRVDPATGAVVQTIPVGNLPTHPTFDGANVWVPAVTAPQVVVVRAVGPLLGTVLAAYSVQFGFNAAAFDGERILLTSFNADRVALWKAADLTPLGTFPLPAGSGPTGVCSDGVKFWVTLQLSDQIVSF